MKRSFRDAFVRPAALLGLAAACSPLHGCEAIEQAADEPTRAVRQESVGGCSCPGSGGCTAVSYADIPSNGMYYVTTFGGGADTQPMSCGGTADGTWAYIADRARFGCGAKVMLEAKGKRCISKVADCGPNKCVEQAACFCSCNGHHPIIDASPFITKHLYGMSGVGWSDKVEVKATVVPDSTEVGCPGGNPPPPPPPKLDAAFVAQGADAPADPDKKAQYRLCTGQAVSFWFELRDTGSASWVDWGANGKDFGQDVRLGVESGAADPLTGLTRISVNENANNDVHPASWNPPGGDCNDKPYCQRTVFTKSKIAGKAPSKAGVYKTTWKLVDEGRAWFGPEMWLSFNVVDCPGDAGAGGTGGGGAGAGATPIDAGGAGSAGSRAGDAGSPDSGGWPNPSGQDAAGLVDGAPAPSSLSWDQSEQGGGCNCRTGASTSEPRGKRTALLLAVFAALALARRRNAERAHS
jgi:MYXO-CTERM domain-containing protein